MGPTSVAPGEIPHLKNDIYYVIAYSSLKDKHRVFGYYTNLLSAQDALENKWKDIEDKIYDSFFIEKYQNENKHTGEIIEYYEIEKNERKLTEKKAPECFKMIKNWALD